MKVVLFCGGKGTRLIEKTAFIPKPLAEISNIPIITHLMTRYLKFGFCEFLLLIGYKGKQIVDYFDDQKRRGYPDIKILMKTTDIKKYKIKIDYLDTGEKTAMWNRAIPAESYLAGKPYMLNYSDGLSDVDIKDIVKFHKKHGKIGTVVIVKPHSQYGKVLLKDNELVKSFIEKPVESFWVNGGFFVFNKGFFHYLKESVKKNIQPLELCARDNQLVAYKHEGFWKCMDTFKDLNEFNEFYSKGAAKWLKF